MPGRSENEEPCPVVGPKFPSLKFPNPALLSSWVQTVTSNLIWTVQPFHALKSEGLNCLSLVVEHKPIVSPLPVPFLALNNLIVPVPSSTSSVPVPQKSNVASKPQDPAAKDNIANGKGEVASTGPAFIGQVYTMCDASRRGLIAVRPADVLKKIKVPPYMKFMEQAYERAMNLLFSDDMKGPVFRFYFDRDDAAEYVRRLNISGSTVGPCSLDAAYKYYKSKQDMFKFMADHRQVKIAKQLVRRERGDKAAKRLKGVPVFTARNLTIAMSTPQGVRWFRPYFFNKKQLDNLIGHSVDHYYEMLISARRAQRHSQMAENSGDSLAGGGEPMEDELDGLMDPPEVQELMEELGQGGGGMEFVGLKVLEAQVMDLADRVLLGHQWSRRMIHLQPRFPVIVDSFERLVSVSESDQSRSKGRVPKDSFKKEEPSGSQGDAGSDEGTSNSGTDEGRTSSESSNSVSKDYREGESSSNSPFNLFGKKWGINANLVFKRKDSGNAGILEEDSDSEYLEETAQKDAPDSKGAFQPKLTMMGIAMNVNKVEGGLQQAMAAAAKDVEDRLRKGEGSGPEHGPLFIANLGASQEWGRAVSGTSGPQAEDAE